MPGTVPNRAPKPAMGAPLQARDLNVVSRASVPAKGAGIKSKSDYLAKTSHVGSQIAEGKSTLRRQGIYNHADGGVKLYGSASKQRRAAAKLAGKPPVNQRKAK